MPEPIAEPIVVKIPESVLSEESVMLELKIVPDEDMPDENRDLDAPDTDPDPDPNPGVHKFRPAQLHPALTDAGQPKRKSEIRPNANPIIRTRTL